MHACSVDHRIGACKINIFKDAGVRLLFVAMVLNASNRFAVENDDFARLNISDKFRSYCVKRTAFRSDNVAAVLGKPADTKRTEAHFITNGNHLGRRHYNKGISSLDTVNGTVDSLLDRGSGESFLGYDV